MSKREVAIEVYCEMLECECGGVFDQKRGAITYMTNPPKTDYECNKCGKIKLLPENDWPKLKYRVK